MIARHLEVATFPSKLLGDAKFEDVKPLKHFIQRHEIFFKIVHNFGSYVLKTVEKLKKKKNQHKKILYMNLLRKIFAFPNTIKTDNSAQ